MLKPVTLTTDRLILRPWTENDIDSFAILNSDPKVREYFPSVLTPQESGKQAKEFMAHFDKHGWGLWAVSIIGGPDFIGFIGLAEVKFKAPFAPVVEIGWRLFQEFWGKGYASEGAIAALKFGFETLKLDKIVAFTVPENHRSRRVMEKIGLTRDEKDDFDHPNLPEKHPLKRHVLYHMDRKDWFKKCGND